MAVPLIYEWDGEAMKPQRRFVREADRQFTIGEQYTLLVHEDRSWASHGHYFACVNEAWKNLPEDRAERWPSADHLRKWALIKSGYRDERSIVCATKAEAQRMGAFVKPMDEFAVVTVSEAVVTVYTAKSQSTRAMGKAAFQASKDAVLGLLSEMIGVEVTALRKAAA